jgi:hypothetical protein
MLPVPEEKALEITAGRWASLAGLAFIVIAVALRKNPVIPAVAATLLTAVAFTGKHSERHFVSIPGGGPPSPPRCAFNGTAGCTARCGGIGTNGYRGENRP